MKIEAIEITETVPSVWGVAINGIFYRPKDEGYPAIWSTEDKATAAIPRVIEALLDNPQGRA